jgi:hypothetical protein
MRLPLRCAAPQMHELATAEEDVDERMREIQRIAKSVEGACAGGSWLLAAAARAHGPALVSAWRLAVGSAVFVHAALAHPILTPAPLRADLAVLFKELATLVVEQGTILDRIDHNMETTVEATQKGVKELQDAEKYQCVCTEAAGGGGRRRPHPPWWRVRDPLHSPAHPASPSCPPPSLPQPSCPAGSPRAPSSA